MFFKPITIEEIVIFMINLEIFRKQTRVNQFQITLCYYLYKCVGENSNLTQELVSTSFISFYQMHTNLERPLDRKSSHRFSLLETGHAGYFYIRFGEYGVHSCNIME